MKFSFEKKFVCLFQEIVQKIRYITYRNCVSTFRSIQVPEMKRNIDFFTIPLESICPSSVKNKSTA